MAKTTLHVTDNSGKRIGVLFLNVDSPTESPTVFESVSRFIEPADSHPQVAIEKRNFWASDGATYMVAGVFTGIVLLLFSWWYSIPMGAIVAGGALVVGVGLHVLKILMHRPPGLPSEPAPQESVIKIESWSQDKAHAQIDYIEDGSITPDELKRVAAAWADGVSFARDPMVKAAKISNGKYRKILSEFQRLDLIHTGKNNHNVLSLRGKSLLRQLTQ